MKKAPEHKCSICGQDQEISPDGDVECKKCGYIETKEDRTLTLVFKTEKDKEEFKDQAQMDMAHMEENSPIEEIK